MHEKRSCYSIVLITVSDLAENIKQQHDKHNGKEYGGAKIKDPGELQHVVNAFSGHFFDIVVQKGQQRAQKAEHEHTDEFVIEIGTQILLIAILCQRP